MSGCHCPDIVGNNALSQPKVAENCNCPCHKINWNVRTPICKCRCRKKHENIMNVLPFNKEKN